MSYKNKQRSKLYLAAEGYDLYAPYYNLSLKFLSTFEKGRFFSMFSDLKDKKVLDIGCGTGRIIGELLLFGANVVAADISPEMLKIVKKKYPKVETVPADIEKLPFENESFDVAVSTFVIVHLKTLDKAFREVYRILKDDGEFILTNINQRKAPKLKTEKGEIVIQSYYHRPQDVISALEENFFKIIREEFVEEDGIWINQIIKAKKL